MSKNIELINSKIKRFYKKYYAQKIIAGTIFLLLSFIVVSLLFLFIEYVLYLNTNIKFILIICYLIFLFLAASYFILLPLFKYFEFIKGISFKKLNDIIVNHFPDIKDKLINIVELSKNDKDPKYSDELIIASIDQKIKEIKYFNFNLSISFNDYLKFLYVLIIAVVFTISLFFVTPSFIKDSTYRLVNYQIAFTRPLPYDFKILNENLKTGKGEDFTLNVFINGLKENEVVNISMGGKLYLLKNDSINHYSYKFNNVNNDLFFQLLINKYETGIFKIEVLEQPVLNNFTLILNKPGYTLQKNEEISNITEITVPVGTMVNFVFSVLNTDSVLISNNEQTFAVNKSKKNEFSFDKKILNDETFVADLKNSNFTLAKYLKINIKTINDEFPTIETIKYTDSTEFTKVYFKGKINDDYGFNRLMYNIKINDKIDTTIELNILKNINQQEFFYAYDFINYKSVKSPIYYYFEIFDNDAVNGPKSSNSEMYEFKFPDNEDIEDFQDQKMDEIENIFQNSMDLTNKLKDDLSDLKKKLLNNELTEWERKEIEKTITSKKKNIENEMQKIIDKNNELNNYLKSFTEQDQQILDKQNQLQKLLEDVFSEDLKKMLEEFNKLMQEYNKDKLNNSKEKLDISLDDLSKQLDRNLELLKKMSVEKKLDQLSKKIDQLIDKQTDNIDKLEQKFSKDDLLKEQNEQKEQSGNLKKDYEELKKLNEELKEPYNLYDFNNEFNEIEKEFSKSLENIQKQNKKQSKESMQKNKSNLDNLKFNLTQMMETLFQEQNAENLEDLMQILDNLITFSFNQEEVINATTKRNFSSVSFEKQKKVMKDFIIVRDSLYSLAQREPSLDSHINKELVEIQNNFVSIEKDFEANMIPNIPISQQKILTSVNNLSLFISEVIKKMQESQANSKPGDQNCNKPGNKPNPNSMNSSMKNMQKSLQQQIEKIMQMMKDGKQGRDVQNEMGKAISQQEAMHDMLQKMMNQGKVGSSAYETLKQADQLLNKVREDILRNSVSNTTLERQKMIMTRLLEADKAENERDLEEKRKSVTATEQFSNKMNLLNKEKSFEINYEEKLIKNKLILNSFYQNKFQSYVLKLDSINGDKSKNRVINK